MGPIFEKYEDRKATGLSKEQLGLYTKACEIYDSCEILKEENAISMLQNIRKLMPGADSDAFPSKAYVDLSKKLETLKIRHAEQTMGGTQFKILRGKGDFGGMDLFLSMQKMKENSEKALKYFEDNFPD